ncbi:MAG: hypothetical protein DIZ80_16930 [endosymbiont of Galathealinum brachiosum]|uniref:Cupin n=1 Tax=endosymbiont of Galathealinum brachiosum TaxID=2200906 RepID=A0A370D6R5_9GAMM|nr:MAG: hypothetical protein DIZ80_16930 [endosymbiont of Galathealinum brachiosum]
MKYSFCKNLSFSLLSMSLLLPYSALAINTSLIVNLPAEKLNWKVTPEGAAFAALEGDRFKGPYMAMVKLPAGITSPMHVKSANMYGMVISGTFSHIAKDAKLSSEIQLPAGSYYMIPANLPHISKCISKVECVSFLYQDGKFDFITELKQ